MPLLTQKPQPVEEVRPLCPFTSFTVPVVKQTSIKTQQPEVGLDIRMISCQAEKCMLYNKGMNMCIFWAIFMQQNEIIEAQNDTIDALDALTGVVEPSPETGAGAVPEPGSAEEPKKS